jgi:ElaB/YqjD/DUF883 family membrane-anchored ribosome-binding protein
MADVLSDFDKPARKATRAGRAAARTAKSTALTVAQEARTFGKRSAKAIKAGESRMSRHAGVARSAGDDAINIAAARLRNALESLQASSEDMSRWAGARASEAGDQTKSLVRERPLGTVGTVFAVGALLGVVAAFVLKAD